MLPTYRTRGPGRGALGAAALFALVACGSEGQVELDLLMPEQETLSPTENEIGEISLVRYMPDQEPRTDTRQLGAGGEALSMGRLEVGPGVSLAVELRTANRRLVGYGRSPGTFEVVVDQVVTVPMNVRRPFVYVSGGTSLASFDSTKDPTVTSSYRGNIDTTRAPMVTVPTHDGANLVTISAGGSGGELALVSTSTHTETGADPVSLTLPPSDAAVSPDSRWVVVGHAGDGGGLSFVDLEAAREGREEVQFVPLGAVGAVAIGNRAIDPLVVALVDRASGSSCPTSGRSSSIVAVPLSDPTSAPTRIEHDTPLHDIAVSDDGVTVVAANACRNELERFNLIDDVQPTALALLQRPTAVAIHDDRAWAVGTLQPDSQTPRRLIIVSVDLDGSGESRVELPPARERAQSNDFTDEGQQAEQRMDADDLYAYDLAVVPGADHIALLTWGYYHAEEDGDFLGAPIIPEMEIEAREYLLVNASTTAVVQRVRTQCELQWVSDPFNPPVLDDWSCARDSGQDVSDTSFAPQHISILYGSR